MFPESTNKLLRNPRDSSLSRTLFFLRVGKRPFHESHIPILFEDFHNYKNYEPRCDVPMTYIYKDLNLDISHAIIKDFIKVMREIDFSVFSFGNFKSRKQKHNPKDLYKCKHVWLRVDRVKRSLEAPYAGPFLVIRRFPKIFIIKRSDGSEDSVSVDRLKPAVFPEFPNLSSPASPNVNNPSTQCWINH